MTTHGGAVEHQSVRGEGRGHAAILAALRRAGGVVLDALLPPSCLACDAPVQRQGQLCAACFRQVTFLVAPLCTRCGVGFVHHGQAAAHTPGGLLCDDCRAAPPAWDMARAALLYDAGSRGLLLALKHADRVELARPLAGFMARAGAPLLARADLLVPVPLHRRRLLARRYNQAALLARALSRLTGRTLLVDALRRHRATRSLGHAGPAERAAALAGAITVRPGRAAQLAGCRVLLIDDVMTSGATAAACSAALLAGGAAHVDVLIAARAQRAT